MPFLPPRFCFPLDFPQEARQSNPCARQRWCRHSVAPWTTFSSLQAPEAWLDRGSRCCAKCPTCADKQCGVKSLIPARSHATAERFLDASASGRVSRRRRDPAARGGNHLAVGTPHPVFKDAANAHINRRLLMMPTLSENRLRM